MARSKAVMVAKIKKEVDKRAATEAAGPAKKRRKLKKSRDREIRKQMRAIQASGKFKIPKAPVNRLIREIAQDYGSDLYFSSEAMQLLQAASEEVITELLQDANELSSKIGKRTTVLPKDVRAAARIRASVEGRFSGSGA